VSDPPLRVAPSQVTRESTSDASEKRALPDLFRELEALHDVRLPGWLLSATEELVMGGVNVESGGGAGGRRSVDSEINMIPMIDLLMVTISFLLITAVWSHMVRINADAQVPGPPMPTPIVEGPSKQLHIEMRPEGKFALVWKQGGAVLSSSEVARNEVVTMEGPVRVVRYPELAVRVASEWATAGAHKAASDRKFDQAVLHTENETPYASIVGVMDAVSRAHRPLDLGKKVESVPAFNLTFAVN